MLQEKRPPSIRCELVEPHARERTRIHDIRSVTLMKLQHRVRHRSDNLPQGKLDVSFSYRRQLQTIIHSQLGPEKGIFVLANAFERTDQVDGYDRIIRMQLRLIERTPRYRLIL